VLTTPANNAKTAILASNFVVIIDHKHSQIVLIVFTNFQKYKAHMLVGSMHYAEKIKIIQNSEKMIKV
jgi:hypothetical protein